MKQTFARVLALGLMSIGGHAGSEPVLTYHNNNARTGANTNETRLTPANVNSRTFGRLLKYPADGYVYAQPLYYPNLPIPGRGTHNVVYIATANNSVYAFDADRNDGPAGGVLWHDELGGGIDLVTRHEIGGRYHDNVFQDMLPQIGIIGTPVIDPVKGILYVDTFTRTESAAGPEFHHKIHALDMADGSERAFSPVEVAASVPGTGFDSTNGVVTFNARQHIQRPALTLAGGVLYVAYGSGADTDPYHGWIISYDASNLHPLTNQVFNTTPDATKAQFGSHAGEGALWMSGDGLCVDADNHLYFEVANGSFNAAPSLGNGTSYGDSFMKLSTTGNRLAVADFFTPYNQAQMQADDADFGSGGALLLPDEAGSAEHRHLMVGGDKASSIYLVDRDNLGRFNPTNNHQIVQQVNGNLGRIFSTPAYFDFHLYYQGIGGVMKAFAISHGHMDPNPASTTKTSFNGYGTTPSISADGRRNAIVWTIQSDGAVEHRPAVLHAYNATNLSEELFNSEQLPDRDNPGNAVKMTVPTIADGKVFVGTQDGVAIFGNGVFLPAPEISPRDGNFNNEVAVTLTDSEPDADIYYTLDGSEPTIHSRHYRTPFTITNSLQVRAVALKTGAVKSPVAGASFVNTAATGGGTGLQGEYWAKISPADFTNESFNAPAGYTRIEPALDFDWRTNGPAPALSPARLLARWSGSVQSQNADNYEFATVTQGGVRLWVNGRLSLNDWAAHRLVVTNHVALKLNAQQRYNVRLEYFTGDNGGTIEWLWRKPGDPWTIIPQTQLYPQATPAPTVSLVNPVEGANFTGSASVTVGAEVKSAFNQIASVELFDEGKSLGSLNHSAYEPVYALTTTGLPAGAHLLTAVVTDRGGLGSTSAPVHITVAAGSGKPYGLADRAATKPFLNMPAAFSEAVPRLLSRTGVFLDTASRQPVAGSIPYALNASMWLDGAVENNSMIVPKGEGPITPDEQLRLRPTGFWKFPDGTVFIKNLDLVVDETKPASALRRLETQILVRDNNGGAYGATYKWRPDHQDADLVTAGLSEDIAITNITGVRTQTWYYASPADCLTCHTPGAGYVLGVNTRQLNGDFTYPATGKTDNQIRTWNRLGLFSPAIDEAKIASFTKIFSITDAQAPLVDRARAYLDVNCAQCHRPGGVGSYDARYDTVLADQRIVDAPAAVTLGIMNARLVKPGDAENSVLYRRISSTQAVIKMPPLAHNLIDPNATRVIGEWINQLPVKTSE